MYSRTDGCPQSTIRVAEQFRNHDLRPTTKGRTTTAINTSALISSYEQKLVDSGTGESASAALLAMTQAAKSSAPEGADPSTTSPVSLMEAYNSGKVRLFVEVLEGSGGRRLDITALNQGDEPFDLVVPAGPLTIAAGFPIGDLNLIVDEEQECSLAPGASSPAFSAGQPGDRGAVGGSFQLTMYEGNAVYQGSVDVGPLE